MLLRSTHPTASSQIQLSNSHCPSGMRHRPHCLRRGGAVVSCIPAPCERACGTPGARCTLGPDANAVFRRLVCIRTFGGAEQVPGVPPAVFFRLLAHLPWRTVPSPKLMSQGGGTG